MGDNSARDKRPRVQDSGFATPAGQSDLGADEPPAVDDRFLTLVHDALAADVKQTAMDAIGDAATEAATAAVNQHIKQVYLAMARAISKQDETYQAQFAAQAASVATVSSSLAHIEKDHDDIKEQIAELNRHMGIAEEPSAATRAEIQTAIRKLPATECDATIVRLNTEDFVSHAEAHGLVKQLAKDAKIAESRITTKGSAVAKNFTIQLDGTPAAAASVVQALFQECRDADGRWRSLYIPNPSGQVKAYLSPDVPEALRAPQMLSKRLFKDHNRLCCPHFEAS